MIDADFQEHHHLFILTLFSILISSFSARRHHYRHHHYRNHHRRHPGDESEEFVFISILVRKGFINSVARQPLNINSVRHWPRNQIMIGFKRILVHKIP